MISQLDHKCTWQCSHGQSWLQNLGQQDSILVSCLAQDPLTALICANSCYMYHKTFLDVFPPASAEHRPWTTTKPWT